MNTYFYELFHNIPRQGPGDNKLTQLAFSKLTELPDKPNILDIGCGKGVQTIELAKISDGQIIATDNHQYFLDCLDDNAKKHDLGHRIKCMNADMANLPFNEREFDLVWSEGAIFIIGIKNGLKSWLQYIKNGGYLVFSDLVWKEQTNDKVLIDYWEQVYPNLLSIDEVLHESQITGYEPITHFTLPKESWINNYLEPIENMLSKLKVKYKDIPEAMEIYNEFDHENEMVRKYYGYFVYEFFIFKVS